jgi:hypothetical protein
MPNIRATMYHKNLTDFSKENYIIFGKSGGLLDSRQSAVQHKHNSSSVKVYRCQNSFLDTADKRKTETAKMIFLLVTTCQTHLAARYLKLTKNIKPKSEDGRTRI